MRFNPDLDYSRPNGAVHDLCRKLQQSSFMHSCPDGCYPHCKHLPLHLRTCRYEYPWPWYNTLHHIAINICTAAGATDWQFNLHHYYHQHLKPQFSSFSTQSATILEDNDRKGRPRIRVLPARNNAHVAPMPQRYFQRHDQAASDHIFLVH